MRDQARGASACDADDLTRRLARFIVSSGFDDLHRSVRHEGARTLVNWVGCAIGGARHETMSIAMAALSPFFGPPQAADSPYSGVIAQFIFKMMEGTTPTIFGDGLTSRDFTFVDNAVNANLLACKAPSSVATGRVFNVGTGKSRTLNEVYEGIAGALGFKQRPQYGPERVGDVKHSLASIERARKELGYEPRADFHEGLEKTVAWYLHQNKKSLVDAS